MVKEIILMLHPTFGVLGMLAALWVLVETLNLNPSNRQRIRIAALAVALLIWLSYLTGGFWYVNYYGADKAIIKAGSWSFAHSFFMETKEHLFFVLLLTSTYLPVVAVSLTPNGHPTANRNLRTLLCVLAALVVLLGLAMEGSGAITALGVKAGLLEKL